MAYGWWVRDMDQKTRQKFDRELMPDEAVTPLWLPPGLQGQRPPSWWTG